MSGNEPPEAVVPRSNVHHVGQTKDESGDASCDSPIDCSKIVVFVILVHHQLDSAIAVIPGQINQCDANEAMRDFLSQSNLRLGGLQLLFQCMGKRRMRRILFNFYFATTIFRVNGDGVFQASPWATVIGISGKDGGSVL